MKQRVNRIFSCLCEPIEDPSVDDANVPIHSVLLKNLVLGLLFLAFVTTLVLVLVSATKEGRDLTWPLVVVPSLMVWLIVLLVSGGLLLSHPYYANRIGHFFRWNRVPIGTNPLLDPADSEISFDE